MQGFLTAALVAVAVQATDAAAKAPDDSATPSPQVSGTPGEAHGPPQLPPEGKRWLDSFVGRFASSDVTMTMGDKPTNGKMELDCRRAAGGRASACSATMTLGKHKQQLALLFGYDVGTGTAHLFEVNSMGDVHDHAGKWDDDKTITVVHRGKAHDGSDEEASLTFARNGAKQMRVTGKATAGGRTVWTFSGTFSKT